MVEDKADNTNIPPFVNNLRNSVVGIRSLRFVYCDIEKIYLDPRPDFLSARLWIEKLLREAGISEAELDGITIQKSAHHYK